MTPAKQAPAKPSPFALLYGAFLLGMGGLLAWLVSVVDDAPMPAWASVLHALVGPWGIFAAFAVPAALLWVGFASQWLGMLPASLKTPVDRALRSLFGFCMTVGLLLGGGAGAILCFGDGRWFFGSLLLLVAVAGAAFSLAVVGARRVAVGLVYGGFVLVLFAGVPAMLGYWAYESHLVGHQGRTVLGGVLAGLWIAAEVVLGVGFLQQKMFRRSQRANEEPGASA